MFKRREKVKAIEGWSRVSKRGKRQREREREPERERAREPRKCQLCQPR